jgi:hypothetical protein
MFVHWQIISKGSRFPVETVPKIELLSSRPIFLEFRIIVALIRLGLLLPTLPLSSPLASSPPPSALGSDWPPNSLR